MTDPHHARDTRIDRRRITEQAASWYLDQREGLPASEQQAFLQWLKQSPLHVGEYLAIARLHGDLHAAAAMETMDAEALRTLAASEPAIVTLRHGHETAHVQDPGNLRRETPPRRKLSRRWLAAAGVAAAALFAAGALLTGSASQPHGDVYASTRDEGRSLTLPDGSLVQLDRDSAIAVNFDTRFRRIDMLRGRALFDVGKDARRPLQVRVGSSVLRDIGTVFAVRRGDSDADVTVVSGRVDVMSPAHPWLDALERRLGRPAAADRVVAALGGGEQARLKSDGAVTFANKPADIEQAMAWLPADIAFHDTSVGDVARRFDAYTRAPLVIDDARIAGMRISGRFRARDVDAFVAYLASLPGVRVQRGDTRVRILAETPTKHARRRL